MNMYINKNQHTKKKFSSNICYINFDDEKKKHQGVVFRFDRRWFNLLWIFMSIALIGLLGRAFYLGIVQKNKYSFIAAGNTLRQTPIIASRGRIYDRNGVVLADNEPNYRLIYSRDSTQKIALDEPRKTDLTYIADTFHLSPSYVRSALKESQSSGKAVVLKDQVQQEENVTYKSNAREVQGFYIEKNASRKYHDGSMFAHIIGYEGLIREDDLNDGSFFDYLLTDRIGKTGVELTYENFLHGTHGSQKQIVDSKENIIKILKTVEAIPGSDLHTSVDADLQRVITKRLQKELIRAKTNRGAAVALDPRDGSVLALVSLPLYDNNKFVHGIDTDTYSKWITDEDRPLFNRSISGAYPPGSTVKPSMGLAVLMEDIISPNQQIESRGGITVGKSFFGDWKAHGFTDLRRAIAVSSDVYFYTVSGGHGGISGLGIDKMYKWMTQFGYGKKTGIDLPGEISGIYPNQDIKQELVGERWYVGDTYNTSIGQGFFTATPLQITQAISVIANGGTLYEPRVVQKTLSPDGSWEDNLPKVIRSNIASNQTMKVVQSGMRATVTEGTGRLLAGLPVQVAGKTGTSQFFGDDQKVHSWFVSYAPFEKPEIVLLILVEGQSGKISSATLPVARDVLEWYFDGRDQKSPWLNGSKDRENISHNGE